jgi:charged multivesicular body protein 4A/B
MDEINDNMENMRQIQDLLSAPMGAAADFDEVSLSLPHYGLWAYMRVFA